MAGYYSIKVKCPYCGTEFNSLFKLEGGAMSTRYFQVCPLEEIEGACGEVFGINATTKAVLVTIYADTESF